MIRTRLTLAFTLLALLAMVQGAFTWWATRSASEHAQRSVVATHLLNQYLELSANKQRLKVWFAQSALAGDAPLAQRERLLASMASNLQELKATTERLAQLDPQNAADDFDSTLALQKNFATLSAAIAQRNPPALPSSTALDWRALIDVFDVSEGQDMRTVLDLAVTRQRQASEKAESDLNAALARVQLANALLTALAVALGVVAVVYFVRRMQQPFEALVQATTALAQGDYSQRNITHQSDEFGQFGRQLNSLAVQLQAAQAQSQQLMRGLDDAVAERTNALTRSHEALLRIDSRRRQFFAELSHELRTPVTVIRGEAEIALRGTQWSVQDYRSGLQSIASAAADLGARVEDLLQAARSDALDYALHLQPIAFDEVMVSSLQKLSAIAAHRQIELLHEIHAAPMASDALWVLADKDRLQQALVILIDNAIRYSPAGTQVRLSLKRQADDLQLIIADQGIGMSDAEQAHAFERHFRGSQAKLISPAGAGLGMGIARDILTAHHGQISLESNAPAGLRVCLQIPALRAAVSPATPTSAPGPEKSFDHATPDH